MPTENRSSTIEQHDHIEGIIDMVSPPAAHDLARKVREYMDRQACPNAWMVIAYEAVVKNFPAPAPQPHPEPIAWMVGTAIWWTKEEAERDAAATGLPIVGLGPMTGATEVERLRVELGYLREERDDLSARLDRFYSRSHGIKNLSAIEQLNDKLAERDALLRELLADDVPLRLAAKIETALSASAEPRAPIAWHVGGNGYDRICFEIPAELPGHPCIQPIHDQRQLIDLLKRYDLRDEDMPPDERVHGISGTSFQRLNALANQGE
ncbi:hypothetical protein [Pseudomonas sp. 3HC3]|uniref:hypothetical protein n=1 Tax=Pseudomonas sp. 3HC3 TaxID=2781025 RepID=UPI0038429D56